MRYVGGLYTNVLTLPSSLGMCLCVQLPSEKIHTQNKNQKTDIYRSVTGKFKSRSYLSAT